MIIKYLFFNSDDKKFLQSIKMSKDGQILENKKVKKTKKKDIEKAENKRIKEQR